MLRDMLFTLSAPLRRRRVVLPLSFLILFLIFGTCLTVPVKTGRAQGLTARDATPGTNITVLPGPRRVLEDAVFRKGQTAPALPETLRDTLNSGFAGCGRYHDELEIAAGVAPQNEPRPKLSDGQRPAPGDNQELARMVEEEQADLAQPSRKSDGAALARHRARVARARELYEQNKLQTGADYYRASLLLLRGEGPEDYRLGRELKTLALAKGSGLMSLQTGPEQDCNSGIPVCQSTYTQTQSYTGVGSSQEVAAGTCLGAGESNSVWYVFTAQTSGSLFFTINTANDYDFALYNITNGGCAAVPGSMPIRCNYSGVSGQTGLQSPAAPETPALSVGGAGLPMMSGVNVTAGQTYTLLVNNFTGDENGYTLTFGGTASITDGTAPQLVSASMDTSACEVEVTTSEPVRCASIAADGSDFNLFSYGAATVTGARGIGCGAFTNRIRLTYALGKGVCGTWAVVPKKGTDGNTLVDNCQNALTHLGVVPVTTTPAVAQLSLPAETFCKGSPIVADGSASTGETRHFWSVVKSDANWNVTGPEYSDWFAGPAGSFDISQFAAQKGLTFECGNYYRIKLAVGGCCTPWHETVKLVRITCQGATSAFTLPKAQYCPGENIIADGSPSQNETNHFWSIQESDQAGHVYGEEIMDWFTGPAGSKNLTQYAASKNFSFKCNTYYRVKLAVAGCGSPWHETTKLVRISCPDAGPDRRVCCNTGYPVQIGSPAIPGVTYSWSSNPAGFTSSFASPVVSPSGTTVYTLTATGPGGCTTTDSVTLTCLTYPELRIDLSTGGTASVKDPYGTPDLDWRVRSIPGTLYGTPPPPSFSVKPLVWISSWATNPFANWISPQVNPDGTPPMLPATRWPPVPGELDYFYEYRFYLDLTQMTNPKIEINELAADNTAEIYLNSQALWGNPNNFTNVGMNQWLDSHFTQMNGPFQITSGFVHGWNTLHVRVRNGGGPWGPSSWTGLLVRGGIRASCK